MIGLASHYNYHDNQCHSHNAAIAIATSTTTTTTTRDVVCLKETWTVKISFMFSCIL